MNSADLARRYVGLDAQFSPDRWSQPQGLAAHREALRSIYIDAKIYPNTFTYSSDGIDSYLSGLETIEQDVVSCNDLGQVADSIAKQLRRDRLAVTAVKERHDAAYTAAQRELYGLPSEELIRQAKESLSTATPEHLASASQEVTSGELAERMTNAFASYDLTDWYVEVEGNMAAKASVNGTLRRVRLRDGEGFSSFDADRLMVHEIGGHVLRWANSDRQSEPWARVPMGRTVPTEEGLAVCREEEFGLLDPKTIRKYQVRCLAVSVAAHSGIMDVIRSISPYVNRTDAAEIAIRTKRGLLDPNAPGGTAKDWGYFDGYLRMQQLRRSSPSDYSLLFGVKWPDDDLSLIKELVNEGRISEPVLLPDSAKMGLTQSRNISTFPQSI